MPALLSPPPGFLPARSRPPIGQLPASYHALKGLYILAQGIAPVKTVPRFHRPCKGLIIARLPARCSGYRPPLLFSGLPPLEGSGYRPRHLLPIYYPPTTLLLPIYYLHPLALRARGAVAPVTQKAQITQKGSYCVLNFWSSEHHQVHLFGRVATKVNEVKI